MSSFFLPWRYTEAQKFITPKRAKKRQKMLAMAPTDPRCTIGTNIKTKAVPVTSMDDFLRRNGENKKTIILVGTVLEVEIGKKETVLGRRRTFVVVIFDLGGGAMKLATINIRSVELHTPEPPRPSTGGGFGERAAATTTTTTGDTTVTNPVSVQVFEAPAPEPLNDEAFIAVVAQPMPKKSGHPLSSLIEAGGLVVVGVLDHVMDASTVEMPSTSPLPRLLPLP